MASSPLWTSCNGMLNSAFLKATRMRNRSFLLSSTKRMVYFSFIRLQTIQVLLESGHHQLKRLNLSRLPQLKPKAAALAGSGFHAHPSAHAFDSRLDNRQADAGAGIFLSLQAGE